MSALMMQMQGVQMEAGKRTLLHGIDLELRSGQLLGILGPNGAGKTSLLRTLLGMAPASQGRILLQDKPLAQWSAGERARHIAYLAQGQQVHWPLPVADVVALGRLPHGDAERPAGEAAIQRAMALTDCQHLSTRNVQTLSGGERARVLLARALATETPILLADEPLAALDPAHQLQIMGLLRQLAGQGMAIAVVLHDLTLASRFCHQVCVLQQGRVQAHGQPAQVLDDTLLRQVFGLQALRLQQLDTDCIVPWEVLT